MLPPESLRLQLRQNHRLPNSVSLYHELPDLHLECLVIGSHQPHVRQQRSKTQCNQRESPQQLGDLRQVAEQTKLWPQRQLPNLRSERLMESLQIDSKRSRLQIHLARALASTRLTLGTPMGRVRCLAASITAAVKTTFSGTFLSIRLNTILFSQIASKGSKRQTIRTNLSRYRHSERCSRRSLLIKKWPLLSVK